MNDFLLASCNGYIAYIGYSDQDEKWIGRVLDTEDEIMFNGDTLDEVLSTYHHGMTKYLKQHNNPMPKHHTQALNMIRYGIMKEPFEKAIEDFLAETGET